MKDPAIRRLIGYGDIILDPPLIINRKIDELKDNGLSTLDAKNEIAKYFGVSRLTVHRWSTGGHFFEEIPDRVKKLASL